MPKLFLCMCPWSCHLGPLSLWYYAHISSHAPAAPQIFRTRRDARVNPCRDRCQIGNSFVCLFQACARLCGVFAGDLMLASCHGVICMYISYIKWFAGDDIPQRWIYPLPKPKKENLRLPISGCRNPFRCEENGSRARANTKGGGGEGANEKTKEEWELRKVHSSLERCVKRAHHVRGQSLTIGRAWK